MKEERKNNGEREREKEREGAIAMVVVSVNNVSWREAAANDR